MDQITAEFQLPRCPEFAGLAQGFTETDVELPVQAGALLRGPRGRWQLAEARVVEGNHVSRTFILQELLVDPAHLGVFDQMQAKFEAVVTQVLAD
jgi:hypothetical protein